MPLRKRCGAAWRAAVLLHYAAFLTDGTVFEIHPARPGRETGAFRLGLAITGAAATPPLTPGRHQLTSPFAVRSARAEYGRITRGENRQVTPAELIAASWAPAARGKAGSRAAQAP
ncbi:hypothetical protein [Streptomyces sp. NPDC019890]|uniref:hypothetical protein n=1 Tax=Streptomyces sp. NPDC019890 TaxID=3365064 RepID=UPI00384BD2CD